MLSGPHFSSERSVDPRGEGRVGMKFGGIQECMTYRKQALKSNQEESMSEERKCVPSCGGEKVINFGNISLGV